MMLHVSQKLSTIELLAAVHKDMSPGGIET